MISNDYTYTYDSKYWQSFDAGNRLEWVMTNGIGGYAGGSIIGAKNRTHQGYLIASLHPPVKRYAVLETIDEWISVDGNEYDLQTARYRIDGEIQYREGYKYLESVAYDGTIAFDMYVPGMHIKKEIGLVRDENTVVIAYELKNDTDSEAVVILTPKFNYREHNTLPKEEDIKFQVLITGDTLSLVPEDNRNLRIDFCVSEGEYYELRDKYDADYELITEVELETEGLCCHYNPYEISISVAPGETKNLSVLCTVVCDENKLGEDLLEAATDRFVGERTATRCLEKIRDYYREVVNQVNTDDIFIKRLVLDADHFLAKRESTGTKTVIAGLPWFTDWGRDTMISLTGLTLCTGRFDDASKILQTFAKYIHNGMVPNMFPDDGEEPLYNTVDASLWYFYATYKYLEYAHKSGEVPDADEFVRTKIFPVLVQILEAYERGTDFSIWMLENGLLHAGSDLDQITWMDVRVGDLVVTPRHGCPVEINALWYNALRIAQELSENYLKKGNLDAKLNYSDLAKHYKHIADKVLEVYQDTFWNEETGCLFDVVDGPNRDQAIRPNQIYAVSLPFELLDSDTECKVVRKVYECLYAEYGLRSLSCNHPDYHGEYRGALMKRDLAYHQGTAWGFLLGGFISAYAKVYATEPDLQTKIDKLFDPIRYHLSEQNCIGGICEIFEGDDPHLGRGCYTQAWSTGEILRAYMETRGDK